MEKNLGPIVQDMPPKGGYPKLEFKRGIGNRGPSGFAIWGAVIGCTVWGFYKLGQNTEKLRLRRKEMRESRMAVIPYLQAEYDFYHSSVQEGLRQRERYVMRNVEGWEFDKPTYSNSYRWAPSDNAEKLYFRERDRQRKHNRVTYAPEYNSSGEKTFWGGRKVYEPYRGDVTGDASSYK